MRLRRMLIYCPIQSHQPRQSKGESLGRGQAAQAGAMSHSSARLSE